MQAIVDILEERVSQALGAVLKDGLRPAAVVRPSQDTRFGDYQANGVMALAKKAGRNPRELAVEALKYLEVSDMCETPEVAGPGFINFRLRKEWVAEALREALRDTQRLGIDAAAKAPTTVVDFSGPNLAKQMHVGHLRSTIIGDVIARVLEFYYGIPGKIIRQNHVGDWGLQIGMVIEAMAAAQKHGSSRASFSLQDLEERYRSINEQVKSDTALAEQCRRRVVRLQQGDKESRALWDSARQASLGACNEIYQRLNVKLSDADVRGESFYNDYLGEVVSELRAKHMLEESEGAQCVFLEGFKSKEGEPLPLIVQKSDGAFLYATTDLAAIRYRVNTLGTQRVIYVTDARQKLHFQMVFACARAAGWATEATALEHVPFGSVLGEDNKPFKTRSGENVKLSELLDEAEQRARVVVEQKNPELSAEQKTRIARAVGIGAVKYADLSNNLVGDYVFSWDKMLAMEGNTAPYMQYAYARVQSIFRKGEIDGEKLLAVEHPLRLAEAGEIVLAKQLLRYGEVLQTVVRDLRPHLLTTYLFDLAQAFSSFYTDCPVLKAETEVRNSRLLLCRLTAATIRHGLDMLGIETIEQM